MVTRMKIRKMTSTNYENEMANFKCPVTITLRKIGGRWKVLVLWTLLSGKKRYSEVKKGIPNVSEKMLIETLKELEDDGLIVRKVYPVLPPHVEYSLTPSGKKLKPVLDAMALWGRGQKEFSE